MIAITLAQPVHQFFSKFHNPLMYNHSAFSIDPDAFLTTFRREKGSERGNRQKHRLVRESSQVPEKYPK